MQAHRLRAPRVDGEVLAEPPLGEAVAALVANRGRFAAWQYDFQGRPFVALRNKAQADAIEAARRYHESIGLDLPDLPARDAPIVATGHQPELFHPGVWVKNFAVAGIAARAGGVGLNLVVDNDIPKGASLRVPGREDGRLVARPVAFDSWVGEAPYEDQSIRDDAMFATFPARVRDRLAGLVPDPLVDRFWDEVMSAPASMAGRDRVGRRFARARRAIEADWGVRNLEVPLSDLCETDGFRWFACHLLAQLPRFQAVHNAALARYRALYKIRSTHHPVSALVRQGDWLEAPFWVWRAAEPRRRPLLVRQNKATMDLKMGGEDGPFLQIPLAADREGCCAVEALGDLPAMGIRLRTRALTTTMFARLLIGDLFIHGIGGAKYDELGDEVARGFFGIAPPGFLTLSMTLHLGLPTAPVGPDDLRATGRRLRDLTWQPERFVSGENGVSDLIAEKRRLWSDPPAGKADRLARYRAFRRLNEAIGAGLDPLRGPVEEERRGMAAALRENEAARSREYSSVLYGMAKIREAMGRVAASVGP